MAIHVAITRKILPGKEQEFKESLRNFLGQSFVANGVQGAAIISSFPGADDNEIGILRSFKDEQERDTPSSSTIGRHMPRLLLSQPFTDN
jgi:hypothetical protein